MTSPNAAAHAPTAQSLLQLEEAPSAELWQRDPVRAHSQWRANLIIANRGYAEHSNRLYGTLFARFVEWLAGHDASLITVDAARIERFLGTIEGRTGGAATVRTRRTYLSEINRVMTQLQSLELRRDNPTLELIATMRLREPLMERNIQLTGSPDLGAQIGASLRANALRKGAAMSEIRGAAMVALMLDAGLTLKEVQKLTVGRCVRAGRDELARLWVKAPGHRSMRSRDLQLSDWASDVVSAWVGLRLEQHAARFGEDGRLSEQEKMAVRLFAHPSKRLALRDMTIQRDVKATLEAVDVSGASPATLRNEFMAKLLRAGVAADEVAHQAGLRDLNQIGLMREALRLSAEGTGRTGT